MKRVRACLSILLFFANGVERASPFLSGAGRAAPETNLVQSKRIGFDTLLGRGQSKRMSFETIRASPHIGMRDGEPLSSDELATLLKVKPPDAKASQQSFQRAWKIHKFFLPILHSRDSCKPPDSSLNIACLWWKALIGNDKSSPAFDNGLSYDMLPRGFRRLTKLRTFFPRLHHAVVEMRTVYMDNAIRDIVANVRSSALAPREKSIRIVSMGAGYDVRGVKFLEQGLVDEVIELDLEAVVEGKQVLLERLFRRRPSLSDIPLPRLVGADFNNVTEVSEKLNSLFSSDQSVATAAAEEWHTIFVFEGVMIYLDKGVPSQLLNLTSSSAKNWAGNDGNADASLVMADLLDKVKDFDYELGKQELESNGWRILDWTPKRGLARHMLVAELLNSQ